MKLQSSGAKILFALSVFTKRIWFRALLYAVVGIATALVAYFARGWVPAGYSAKVGADAVGDILTILASSMLAVATFSLSIMVTAFGNASTGASPRATKLLIENQNAQRAVSTFIGAFLYSIVGIIALTTGMYGEDGRFVLFLVTILVVSVIVVTLIKWVDQLATLGRIGSTILEVERATLESLRESVRFPHLGGRSKSSFPIAQADGGSTVVSQKTGFIAFIDMEAIQQTCEELNVEFDLWILPGSFSYPGRVLGKFNAKVSDECLDAVCAHLVVDVARTFRQDARFGFVLLSEIASRALSPAVNDPGTAIEVISSAVRLLAQRSELIRGHGESPVRFPSISVRELSAEELIGCVIAPIARDGAGTIEVGVRIQKALRYLAAFDPTYAAAADRYTRIAFDYGMDRLEIDYETALLRDAFEFRAT